MSITRVYRDRDNKIKVEKFSFDEVKKDLTKFFSHDNRISNRKDKNDNKKIYIFKFNIFKRIHSDNH